MSMNNKDEGSDDSLTIVRLRDSDSDDSTEIVKVYQSPEEPQQKSEPQPP